MAVVTNSVATGVGGAGSGGGGGGGMNGNGDTAPYAWQTVTPNVSNAVAIVIDRNLGTHVKLLSPVDNTQVVNAPLNMTDGEDIQINLVGGGGSGNWAAYTFLTAAPSADALSSNYTAVYVNRRGSLYEGTVGAVRPV